MINLTIARTIRHMTPADLAEKIGASRQYISQLESGTRNLGPANAETFAALLNVEKAWLLGCPSVLPVYDPIEHLTVCGEIIHAREIAGYGVFYLVYLPDTGDVMPVINARGMQYTLTDWQAADMPRNVVEVADYKWMDATGTDAVMVDGLQRFIG